VSFNSKNQVWISSKRATISTWHPFYTLILCAVINFVCCGLMVTEPLRYSNRPLQYANMCLYSLLVSPVCSPLSFLFRESYSRSNITMGQNVGKGAHYRYQIYTLVTVSDIYSGHGIRYILWSPSKKCFSLQNHGCDMDTNG